MQESSRRVVTVSVTVLCLACIAMLAVVGGRAGATPGAVYINSRLAERPEQPGHFGWMSTDNTEGTPINWVREISWTSWGGSYGRGARPGRPVGSPSRYESGEG